MLTITTKAFPGITMIGKTALTLLVMVQVTKVPGAMRAVDAVVLQ